MPEGPSIVILREVLARFTGKKILRATGNARIDMARIAGQKVTAFRSWGKHFLIEMPHTSVRVHFLMFGSWTVNERKDREPRLQLQFRQGEVNFYSCAIRLVEEPLDEVYDWSADVMSDAWDAAAARRKLRAAPDTLICDALLDQSVFAGVGNIIKNEVLFRVKVHPLSTTGALPAPKLRAVVDQASKYSFEFLAWRRAFVLRKHWLVHNKGTCPSCGGKLTREWLGVTNRRTFYCERCQQLYGARTKEIKKQPQQKKMKKSKKAPARIGARGRRQAAAHS